MQDTPKLNSSSTILNDIANDDITKIAQAAALAEIDLITDIDELKYIRKFVEDAVNTGRLPYNSVLNAVTLHTNRQIAVQQALIPYKLPEPTEAPQSNTLTNQQNRLKQLYAMPVTCSPFE